jgi:F0F1-type ATP synthase assembly protein I
MSSTRVSALDTSQVKNLSVVAIVAVVVVGLLIAWLVSKVVTRVIVLALTLVLGFAFYNQRAKVVDEANKIAKRCDATFFGIHVQPSDPNIKKACELAGKIPKK